LHDLVIEMLIPAFCRQFEVGRKIIFIAKDILDGAFAFEDMTGSLAGNVGIGRIAVIDACCEIDALPGVDRNAAADPGRDCMLFGEAGVIISDAGIQGKCFERGKGKIDVPGCIIGMIFKG